MEPSPSSPQSNPERSPAGFSQNFEQAPLPPPPEVGFERGAEQVEQRSEAPPAAVNAPPAMPTPVVAPVAPAPYVVRSDDTSVADDDLPTIANDDDVIEKEWVDKAKKIIAETRNDPHKRELEVTKLQADYLQKRYGKTLGAIDG